MSNWSYPALPSQQTWTGEGVPQDPNGQFLPLEIKADWAGTLVEGYPLQDPAAFAVDALHPLTLQDPTAPVPDPGAVPVDDAPLTLESYAAILDGFYATPSVFNRRFEFVWGELQRLDSTIQPATFAFADLTGLPTTLGGYGITDAFTQTQADARYAQLGHLHDDRYALLGHNHDSVYLALAGGTLTGLLAFNAPLSAANQLLDLQQGYSLWSDNLGAGTAASRVWLDAPDGGEIVLGPRASAQLLDQLRIRARTVLVDPGGVLTAPKVLTDEDYALSQVIHGPADVGLVTRQTRRVNASASVFTDVLRIGTVASYRITIAGCDNSSGGRSAGFYEVLAIVSSDYMMLSGVEKKYEPATADGLVIQWAGVTGAYSAAGATLQVKTAQTTSNYWLITVEEFRNVDGIGTPMTWLI